MKSNYLDLIKLAIKTKGTLANDISIALKKIKASNINVTQFLILKDIGEEELTFIQISRMGISEGKNPNYNLASMYNRGYLIARGCPNDKRKVYYKLSDKAKELCANVDKLMGSSNPKENISEASLGQKIKKLLAA